MTIDIDAIRQRAGRYAKTPIGSGKTILAIQMANEDVPALLARVDELEYAHHLQQRDLLGAIGERDAAHATIREVLAMLERFDTPRDSGRVRVLVGDLKHITYKALTEAGGA